MLLVLLRLQGGDYLLAASLFLGAVDSVPATNHQNRLCNDEVKPNAQLKAASAFELKND